MEDGDRVTKAIILITPTYVCPQSHALLLALSLYRFARRRDLPSVEWMNVKRSMEKRREVSGPPSLRSPILGTSVSGRGPRRSAQGYSCADYGTWLSPRPQAENAQRRQNKSLAIWSYPELIIPPPLPTSLSSQSFNCRKKGEERRRRGEVDASRDLVGLFNCLKQLSGTQNLESSRKLVGSLCRTVLLPRRELGCCEG